MTTKNQQPTHWQVTINVHTLSLGDWLEIANAIVATDEWACRKWIDNYYNLSALSLEDWKEVAEEMGLNPLWAVSQYERYSSKAEPKAITH